MGPFISIFAKYLLISGTLNTVPKMYLLLYVFGVLNKH